MIGKLKGFVSDVFEDYIIFDVNDVGYRVFCSNKTLNKIQTSKEKLSLYIETLVKEDSITLFGFLDLLEKDSFNILCKVNGVGAKMALKIMSVLDLNEISDAIVNNNKDVFSRVPGIGTKLATRIVSELQDSCLTKNFVSNKSDIQTTTSTTSKELILDATKALENLGYPKNIVQQALNKFLKDKQDLPLESIITGTLRVINNF